MRSVFVLAFGLLACAAVADLSDVPASHADRAAFVATCEYYGSRARTAEDAARGDFMAFLSEVCSTAERLLQSGTPEQRGRSALLLTRITELRRTVTAMSAARGRGHRAGLVPVSASGEFLIAHRLGVLRVFEVWLDSGVEFSIASYP